MPDYEIFEAGDVVLQSGLTYRKARLAYKTYGTLDAAKIERHRLPDFVRRAALRSRMGDRTGQGARPDQVFHRHHEQVRQRPVVVAEQYAAAVRPRPLAAFHDDRQCPGATATAARSLRHRAGQARLRVLDGRAAGLSLGRAVPRPGRAHRRDLRLGEDLAAQFRLSRRGQGGIDRRPGLAGRLVRRPHRPAAFRRWAGSMPAGG